MMKRNLYLILYIAAFAWAFTACSESEELAATPANSKVTKINVSPYPAFTEDAGTRSVGTFDAGKTAWDEGDEIKLMVSYTDAQEHQCITLTYDGTKWTADKNINWLTSNTVASALYAPDWEYKEGALSPSLKENAKYGTSEYLEILGRGLTDDGVLSINFSNAKRNYNRLRIAGETSFAVDVVITQFRPFGTSEFKDYNYSLTTDAKGNAYLYGSWEEGASLTITGTFDVNGTDKETITLFSKSSLSSTSGITNKSYVADARISYKNEGTGTEADPYKISRPRHLAVLATDVNSGAFTGTDKKYFVLQGDLDLSEYEDWTPIGNTDHPFTGVFDGQGHTISNLKIDNNNPNDVKEWGLFGMVQDATIQFVRVDGSITLSNFGDEENNDTDDYDGVGGIAGRCCGTENNFYGCHSNVNIKGTGSTNMYQAGVGGIVGFVKEGQSTFVACYTTGELRTEAQASSSIPTAGLVGRLTLANKFSVYACYCNAYISCLNNGTEKGTGALFSSIDTAQNPTNYILMDAFYWSQVSGKPDALYQGIVSSSLGAGAYQIESTEEWETAMTKMNEYLFTNHSGFGYEYVKNTGEDKATVPLVLQAKTTSNNE